METILIISGVVWFSQPSNPRGLCRSDVVARHQLECRLSNSGSLKSNFALGLGIPIAHGRLLEIEPVKPGWQIGIAERFR